MPCTNKFPSLKILFSGGTVFCLNIVIPAPVSINNLNLFERSFM